MSFFQDSAASLFRVADWSRDTAAAYLGFLRRALIAALLVAVTLVATLLFGIVAQQGWLISVAALMIGLVTVGVLLLATPLAVPTIWTIETFQTVKTHFRIVVAALLWALLFSLYLAIVPISNNPAAIVLVLLLASAVAVLWARYGFGPNLPRMYASLVMVFVLTTVGFFLPKSFAAAGAIGPRIDDWIANCITNPSKCLAARPQLVDASTIPQLEFFDPSTGAAKYWYYRRESGEYEIYDAPGFHPQTRDSLRIVTPEAVKEILRWSSARETSTFNSLGFSTVPDLSRAVVVHRARSVGDLNAQRAVVREANGSFDVETATSRFRSYTPVFVQLDTLVQPNVFITADVLRDTRDIGIITAEVQGLNVHFMVTLSDGYYSIYDVPERCCSWKPLRAFDTEGWNTLGMYQLDRQVWVYLNWQAVDSLTLWNSPTNGRVGLFFKADPDVRGHVRFARLAVYEF